MPPLDPYEGLGTPVDPYEGLGTPEPTQSYFADKARRFARDGIKGIGQLVASPGTALQSIAQIDADLEDWLARKLPGGPTDAEIAAQRAKMDALMQLQTPMLAAQALRNVGADVGKAFPQIGPADPARDREVGSAVASGAGSLVPLLATAGMGTPAQVLAGGGLMGEQQREDAERSGATPSQQAASFGLGGATGLASEALLGLPAMLRSVRGAKIVPQAMASAEAGVDKLVASQLGNLGQMVPMLAKAAPTFVPIMQQAVKTAVREGVQEGIIEQIAQNTIAKDIVAYDPTRDRTEGVGMAMLAGSIVGGGLGAGTQALAGLDTRKNLAETAATLAAQQEQLLAGRRAAQMFPVDAQGNVTNELPLPEGMRRLETERGVFHYNPQQITADEIFSASAKGAENRALNLGSTSKPEAEAAAAQNNEPLVTITERTPDGTEVRSAVINQSAAEKTMAEMQAGLTPGNSLVVETPEKTLAGRAPDFLAEILNRDAQALAARQAADAKEKTAREQRQRDLDAKKENVGEAMQQGDAVLQDSAATFADVQGALKRVQFYAENNALGITQDQRIAAQRQQAKLAQRLAALEPAEMARRDLENQKRLADDAAALAAQKAQRTQAKQEFKQEVTAGRDATGAIDYTRLSDDDLATRAQAGDKKAEREMMARNDRAGDDRPTLLDVLAKVKLPEFDVELQGEIDSLVKEGMTPEQRRKFVKTGSKGLDAFAEVMRADHGFSQMLTPSDAIDLVQRALRGEDIRPDRTGEGQVEFATIQDTFDLGGTPVGIDLPNQVRNLTPRWQEKTLAFESSLDKALYYAGGTNSETRDLVATRLSQQTGLTTGQIATLARQLRTRIEPLTRSAAQAGTIRVPAQMRSEVAAITGIDFATAATEGSAADETRGQISETAPAGPQGQLDLPRSAGDSNRNAPAQKTAQGSPRGTGRGLDPQTSFPAIPATPEALRTRSLPEIEAIIRRGGIDRDRAAAALRAYDLRLTQAREAKGAAFTSRPSPIPDEATAERLATAIDKFDAGGKFVWPAGTERLKNTTMYAAGSAPQIEPTDNATIERELTALLRAFPRLAVLFKLRIGSIPQEFDKAAGEAGYKGQIPSNVEAAVWGQKRLIVIAARAWRDRNNGAALVTHEVAHLFWDTLPTAAKTQLRALHAKETGTKTGPLYTAQGFMRGSIQFERDRLPVARVAADPDLPVKEWFAERIAMINKAWAEGRLDRTETTVLSRAEKKIRAMMDRMSRTDKTLFERLAFELRQLWRQIVETFAIRSNIDPDSELFEAQFRAFILAGADAQIGRNAGTSYAQKKTQFAQRPDFASGKSNPPAYPTKADNRSDYNQQVAKWEKEFEAWTDTQGNMVGPFRNARDQIEIVTRNTRVGEKPWRVTRYDAQREVIAHDDYATKAAAAKSAAAFGKYSPTVNFATGERGLSWQRFQEWSDTYASFEDWNQGNLNTPGRQIRFAGERFNDYELRLVPVADIVPSQSGEDYLNDSSRETARRMKTGTVVEARTADLAPILLEKDGRTLLDGNHRHAAATLNGDREILAIVPIGPGTGQVVNLRKFYDENLAGTRPEFASGEDPELPEYPKGANSKDGPLSGARRISGEWRDVMPGFQGNKKEMAVYAAEKIRSALPYSEREKITTIQDWFGGGGSWGLHLALTHFPMARRLHVHEYLPDRLEKIRLFHTEGAAIKADLDALTPQINEAYERMRADDKPSPAAFITRLKAAMGEDLAERTRAIVTALEDRADHDFASSTDAQGQRSAAKSIADLLAKVVEDAANSKRAADAFRARGGQIDYSSGDSYAQPIEPGETTFSVFDPPYYKTAGYSGADSVGGKVPLSIYIKTAQRLNELASAGHGILYTDSAWWIDEQRKAERKNANDKDGLDLGDVTSVAPDPEGRSRLSYILDSIDSATIVPIADRNEILGLNAPGSSQRALARQESPRIRDDGRNNAGQPRDQRPGAGATGELTLGPAEPAPAGEIQGRDAALKDRAGNPAKLGAGDSSQRLAEIEAQLAGLAESQEDQSEINARGQALTDERDRLQAEQRAEQREKQVESSIIDVRHPTAVGTPEPGEAWMMVPRMTDAQLRQERMDVGQHLVDNYQDLGRAGRALLNARIDAIRAEEARRAPQPRRDAEGNALVDPIPKTSRRDALIAELKRGRDMAGEANRTGNDEALKEGTRLVRLAKERLDEEFPGWETAARPTTAQAPSAAPDATDTQPGAFSANNAAPPPPPAPPIAEAAQPDDAEPSPFTGENEEKEPIRKGKIAEVYGHSSYQPGVFVRTWRKVRDTLVGIRGPIPELPAFPGSALNAADRFIKEKGPQFYNGLREFYRALKSGNDYIQRTAEEQVARITRPLIEAGGKFSADDYAKLQTRQEQARRLRAEGKPVPPGVIVEITALQSKMEGNPYVLFNRLVLMLDLKWRHENLKDSRGNSIALPSSLNRTEVNAELARLRKTIQAGPHVALIRTALERHMQLVKDVAADLQSRELIAAEQLANPYYFPHLTLEIKRGDKTEQRELTPTRVRPGTEVDFRGYLQDPVGSRKPIETDYVRALYYHLVQVGAHNLKADAIANHARPYNIMKEVRERAEQLSRTRGESVSWEQAFNEEFEPAGYERYGTDSRDAFPTIMVDRDKLARRLGRELTSEDLQQQLARLGMDGVRLMPEDLKETLMAGNRETWIVPARVAEALRGIADRETRTTGEIEAAMKWALGKWKAWKLFMPWNHIRYEYGNVVADVEKIFSATPGTFMAMPEAAREIRAFWLGGEPSADLRAALKDGVINAITAQEMGGLVRLRAFKEFETTADKVRNAIKRRGSSALLQPLAAPLGLGDFSSPELSAFREAVFRYANFKHNLARLRAGERPDYGGAYHRDIDAMQDSKPGANDRAQRQAGQISKATFGDYGDISVLGQSMRDKLIPFYSWMEVNFKYHANVFRNLRDMVRANEVSKIEAAGKGARAAATFAAGFGARAAGNFVLRLALPYVAVALWNGGLGAVAGAWDDDDEIEKDLSEEDRRRFHIILGRNADGTVNIVYGQTALIDIMKWFSGARFAQQAGAYLNGKTDFPTALAEWRDNIVPDFLNNTVGSFGPYAKIPVTLATKKNPFPDVTDMRTVPAYDMRRVIIGQIADDFTADQIERIVSKDYYAARDFGTWAKQLVLQVRQRDPEAWAFYAIKDKAAEFEERMTGNSDDSSRNSEDQQVLRNFRRAIYKGDVEKAVQFYQRLLDYKYTADRFKQSIRAQEPLAGLPKENGLRAAFVASLTPDERRLLDRAQSYYTRINSQRGEERGLFPSERSGAAGLQRFQANPQVDRLRQTMERNQQLDDDARRLQAERALQNSLRNTR